MTNYSPASASTRPLAVVTGASSSIGYELAKQFAKNGFDLLITATGADNHKDDPAEVARLGFEVLMDGKDSVLAESLKTKVAGLVGKILPDPLKAELHRQMSEPGSANN
jgi:NAD(P)-dependent dehydrogenase (short-subunit alcohol dehydrogenase family)